MNKETIAVMLPTKESDIHLNRRGLRQYGVPSVAVGISIPQHLYICTTEEIKKGFGFYVLDPHIGTILKVEEELSDGWVLRSLLNSSTTYTLSSLKKYLRILATTDSSFRKLCKHFSCQKSGTCHGGCIDAISFPTIPQSFIDKYIEQYNKGNKIEKVMVEHDTIQEATELKEFYSEGGQHNAASEVRIPFNDELKLNGNEIVICEEKLTTCDKENYDCPFCIEDKLKHKEKLYNWAEAMKIAYDHLCANPPFKSTKDI